MDQKFRIFADCHSTLSESPMWNPKENMLYWRGFDGEIYRKAINNDKDDFECFQLNIGKIGSMVFTTNDNMLLFAEEGKIWSWKPYTSPILFKDFKTSTFNDVLTDPYGRIYCGILTENYFDPPNRGTNGSLWCLYPDGTFTCLDDKIGTTPNGIRLSPELDKLYLAVTDDDCIYVYDYDKSTGNISNRQIFVSNCCPDGIAIDVSCNLWVTNCRPGNPLICYNKKGEILEQFSFPVHRVISVAFGGENNKFIFVTTAHEKCPRGMHDGGVFIMKASIPGAKEYFSDIKV